MRRSVILTLAAQLVAGFAAAIPLTMTFEGTGSGTVGATPFSNAGFVVTLTIETENNSLFNNDPTIVISESAPATIEVDGIGLANFTNPKRVFCNQNVPGVGLSNDIAADLIDIEDPVFGTYDLTTPIGPVFEAQPVAWQQFANVPTSLGDVTFTAMSDVTFLAQQRQLANVPTASPLGSLLLFMAICSAGALMLRKSM